MKRILVIEDDPGFCKTLEGFLKKLGYDVEAAFRGSDGLEKAEKFEPHLVLLDHRLPDGTGTELLPKLRRVPAPPEVILITGFSDIRTAVMAMKLGAYDYITKPVNPDELRLLVEKAIEMQESGEGTTEKPQTEEAAGDDRGEDEVFVKGTSPQSRHLHQYINLVAPTDMTVLILGESGTGKEYVARSIHEKSKRKSKPFVAVDCGALSEELAISELFGHVKGSFTGAMNDKDGRFLVAEGGTLFLDEVGNLSHELQVKLLRALQERVIQPLGSNKTIKVDVRIITATNENLAEKVSRQEFREDLYHRINEFKIQVPDLVDRKEDFWEFTDFFRKRANRELNRSVARFDPKVVEIFEKYSWPGNLRELRNVIRRAVLLSPDSDVAGVDSLPDEMKREVRSRHDVRGTSPYDLKARQENSERETILRTLEEVKFNKSKAARLLNIDRKTLYLKIERYNIDA